jgi:type VI secretion system secreted protein VgrG
MPETTTLPEVAYGLDVEGDTKWEVVRVHFAEGLSELYEGTLEVARAEGGDPRELLGSRCVLTATRGEATRRRCGVIVAVRDRGWVARRRVVELQVAPTLWLLGLRTTWRIFQEVHAIAVVEEVLKEAGIYQGALLVKRLGSPDPLPREYCTQYGETDLAFVRRLLEEEGVTFGFSHEGAKEALVLTNGGQADIFPRLDTGGAVPVMGQGGETETRETVRALDRAEQVVLSGVRLRDYDFTHPTAIIEQKRGAADALGERSRMEYPARVTLGAYNAGSHVYGESDVRRLATVREEESLAPAVTFHGWSNVTALEPGQVLEVLREDSDTTEEVLVVRVTHLGEAPEVLHLDEGGRSKEDRYHNAFACVPAWLHFRPARVTPKPRAMTPQSAVVVAEPKASADTICTDAHGRVKVRFQWDRPPERPASQSAKNASCWVRTTQAWAGAGWGFVFLPRVGMEVLVQYLDADPDRPVVTGCLYNAVNTPPEKLPDTKTKSILRTQSTPGTGHNELSFEDEGGKEVVHLRAQKDYTELVLNDHTVDVKHDEKGAIGNDQTWTVGHDRLVTVKNDDTLNVEKNRSVVVTENDTLEVSKNLSVTVFEASTFTVSKTHTMAIDEGMTCRVGGNSGTLLEMKPQTIKLTCGQTAIEMTESAITLTAGGVTVKLDQSAGVKATATSQVLELSMSEAKLAGAMATVSAQATLSLEGQATAKLASSGITQVQGSLVKIN